VAARDALVIKYSPWARVVARDVFVRVHSLRDAWNDCVQNALIGLIESIDRFDPSRGATFQTYARYRVRGAVFNGLRNLRESRFPELRLTEQCAFARDRIESFESEDIPDLLETFVATTVGLGLGFLLETNSLPQQVDLGEAYAQIERDEISVLINASLGLLTDRERAVLVMHYFHHVAFVDIARELYITKGRVSQLHKQGITRLRILLADRVCLDYG